MSERKLSGETEIQAFEYPYDHPVTEEIKRQFAQIQLTRKMKTEHNKNNPRWISWNECDGLRTYGILEVPYNHSQAVYILDSNFNIIDWVEAKYEVGYWLKSNSPFKKGFSRRLVYEYIKEQKLYKDKYYFVTVKEYKDFIRSKKL
ncbi:hypothetical protein [Radiobacillus deserti]|uniref:Uncharacterized protein n=1 Tax=Radiobacillus deserti TaxID=2594883 RepID=A0A516KDP6_9BACI|nr:hypothetical protein [Radiobacillus deserti]QDP39436.1 hypothetical protein FN924_04145 [Radiobacillus deserti]